MFWDISQKHISNIVQFCVYQTCYKFVGKIYSIFCRQQNVVFFMCTSSYVRLRFKQLEFNLFLCSLLDFITPWRKLTVTEEETQIIGDTFAKLVRVVRTPSPLWDILVFLNGSKNLNALAWRIMKLKFFDILN